MLRRISRLRRRGGGFNPLLLSPVLYIRDLTTVVGGYFVDSSGRNTQCQAATTNVANDSIIMPANNTAIINALKAAHNYHQYYTNDSTPKKVLLETVAISTNYQLYCNIFTGKNLLLFAAQQELNHDKILSYIGIYYTLTVLEDKVFTSQGTWTFLQNGTGSVCEIADSKLHQKMGSAAGSFSFPYKTNIFALKDYLKITYSNITRLSGDSLLLVGSNAAIEDSINTIVAKFSDAGNKSFNFSTIPLTSSRYISPLLYYGVSTSNSEMTLDSIKIEKINYYVKPLYSNPNNNIIVEGDSQCTSYPDTYGLNWAVLNSAKNFGVPNQKTTALIPNLETHLIDNYDATKNNIVVILTGVNDFSSGTSVSNVMTMILQIASMCNAHGFTPYFLTQRQWGSLGTKSGNWDIVQSYRTALLTNANANNYRVIDWANDSHWANVDACDDLTYYKSDKIHLTFRSHYVTAKLVNDSIG